MNYVEIGKRDTNHKKRFYTNAKYEDVSRGIHLTLTLAKDNPSKYKGWSSKDCVEYVGRCVIAHLESKDFTISDKQDEPSVGADYFINISEAF